MTSHKNFNEELMQISRHVENAEGYGRVTDVLFASAVTYGRLYVWKTFSRILYETLTPNERKKMDIIYNQKWWTLFYRSDMYNKFVMLYMLVW